MSMNFESALSLIKGGHTLAREGWNGKGMWIALMEPDCNDFIDLPYIYLKVANYNSRVPWLASQTDLLADDWCVL